MKFLMNLIWLFFAVGACAFAAGTIEHAETPEYEYVKPVKNFPGWYEKQNHDGSRSFVERDRLFGGIVKRVVLQEVESLDKKEADAIVDLSHEEVDEAFKFAFSPQGDPILRMCGVTKNAVVPAVQDAQMLYQTLQHRFAKLKKTHSIFGTMYTALPADLREKEIFQEKYSNQYRDGLFVLLVKAVDGEKFYVQFDLVFDQFDAAYVVKISVEKDALAKYAHILYGVISMLFELEKSRAQVWMRGAAVLLSFSLGSGLLAGLISTARTRGLNLGFAHLGVAQNPHNPFNGHDIALNKTLLIVCLASLAASVANLYQMYQTSQPLLDDDEVENDQR
jgi:hypothetical protein